MVAHDLYFARKKLCKHSKIGEHARGNDKSKLIVHLVAEGAGPPLRQPCDPQEENARLAWYFQRQQEQQVGDQLLRCAAHAACKETIFIPRLLIGSLLDPCRDWTVVRMLSACASAPLRAA